MKIINNFEGHMIRLTDERMKHILLHSEMKEFKSEIEDTIRNPQYIIQSMADKKVKHYLKFYITKQFSGKYLCVVVKFLEDDAFIITSYLIRELLKGEIIWHKN